MKSKTWPNNFIAIWFISCAITIAPSQVSYGADRCDGLCASISGLANETLVPVDARLAAEMAAMFKTPTTPFELLQNIKFAVEGEFFLREQFYSEETLKKFSGGTRVHRIVGDPNGNPKDIFCEVAGFEAMVASTKVGNIAFEGLRFSARRSFLKNGKLVGTVSLGFAQTIPALSFDRVTGLFGSDWIASKDLPSPHTVLQRPTEPHGNARIVYIKGDRKIKLYFGPSAALGSAEFSLQRGD